MRTFVGGKGVSLFRRRDLVGTWSVGMVVFWLMVGSVYGSE